MYKNEVTAERNIAHINSYKPDKTAAVLFYIVLFFWEAWKAGKSLFYSASLSASNMPLGNNLIIYNS